MQIAVKQGYINGVGNNRMAPEGTLTREQAATILGRLHKYTPTADLSALDMFSDRAKLSDYSKSYVAEAVKQVISTATRTVPLSRRHAQPR